MTDHLKSCPTCHGRMRVNSPHRNCKHCRSAKTQADYRKRKAEGQTQLSRYVKCPRCPNQMFRQSSKQRLVDPWGQVCGGCWRNLTQTEQQGQKRGRRIAKAC